MKDYINQSMKQVCAEIEAQQSWEDEQFMRELDAHLNEEEVEQAAWDAYQSGICPCGDPECGGIPWAWLLNE